MKVIRLTCIHIKLFKENIYHFSGVGELGFQGFCIRIILVLCEFMLNVLVVYLVLPTFDVAGSLGFPPH